MIVEEKSTKPPITGRFTRKFQDDEDNQRSAKTNYGGGLDFDNSTKRAQTANDGLNSTLLDICQQLLVEGFVQSYIDFYHLSHRYFFF